MKTMRLAVQRGGDTKEYPVTPAVVVAFEREFKTGLGKAFGEGGENKAEHMYWLAWKATHAAGDVVKPFDGWLADLEGVDIVDDDVAPFDQAPSDG